MKNFKETLATINFFTKFAISGMFVAIPKLHKYEKLAAEGKIDNLAAKASEVARKWSDYCLGVAKAKITVNGLEKIPQNEPVLFVSNHQSYADIPVLVSSLRNSDFGFVIKDTMAALPLINHFVEPLLCAPITQSDIRQSVAALNQAAENIKNGHSMLIFPEGRREFTNMPRVFKNGAFKIVQKTGVTVVPIYLRNVHLLFEGNGKRLGSPDITVTVLDPIKTSDMSRADIKVLNEKVRNIICDCAKTFE